MNKRAVSTTLLVTILVSVILVTGILAYSSLKFYNRPFVDPLSASYGVYRDWGSSADLTLLQAPYAGDEALRCMNDMLWRCELSLAYVGGQQADPETGRVLEEKVSNHEKSHIKLYYGDVELFVETFRFLPYTGPHECHVYVKIRPRGSPYERDAQTYKCVYNYGDLEQSTNEGELVHVNGLLSSVRNLLEVFDSGKKLSSDAACQVYTGRQYNFFDRVF